MKELRRLTMQLRSGKVPAASSWPQRRGTSSARARRRDETAGPRPRAVTADAADDGWGDDGDLFGDDFFSGEFAIAAVAAAEGPGAHQQRRNAAKHR